MHFPTSNIDHIFDNHPPQNPTTHERLDRVTEIMKRTCGELMEVIPQAAEPLEGNAVIEYLQLVSFWAKAAIARNQ